MLPGASVCSRGHNRQCKKAHLLRKRGGQELRFLHRTDMIRDDRYEPLQGPSEQVGTTLRTTNPALGRISHRGAANFGEGRERMNLASSRTHDVLGADST